MTSSDRFQKNILWSMKCSAIESILSVLTFNLFFNDLIHPFFQTEKKWHRPFNKINRIWYGVNIDERTEIIYVFCVVLYLLIFWMIKNWFTLVPSFDYIPQADFVVFTSSQATHLYCMVIKLCGVYFFKPFIFISWSLRPLLPQSYHPKKKKIQEKRY